jgi:hypothetical protein
MRRWMTICLAGIAVPGFAGCAGKPNSRISQQELVRRTQEIMDAVATGDRKPFEKYYAADVMFFDEKGRSMDKTALLNDVAPLPVGYSGTIKIVNPQMRLVGDTALLTYDLNETEAVFGQQLTARYHETDTWIRRNGEWQIAAGQVLRYYEDPAAGQAEPQKYGDYTGVYELAPGKQLMVSIDGKDLYQQRSGKAKSLLLPEASDIFFSKGVEGRWLFRRGQYSKVDALIDRRNNEDIVWRKVK